MLHDTMAMTPVGSVTKVVFLHAYKGTGADVLRAEGHRMVDDVVKFWEEHADDAESSGRGD